MGRQHPESRRPVEVTVGRRTNVTALEDDFGLDRPLPFEGRRCSAKRRQLARHCDRRPAVVIRTMRREIVEFGVRADRERIPCLSWIFDRLEVAAIEVRDRVVARTNVASRN